MRETMRDAPGVGLAAPQVGLPLQLTVIEDRVEYHKGIPESELRERGRQAIPFHVLINPSIERLLPGQAQNEPLQVETPRADVAPDHMSPNKVPPSQASSSRQLPGELPPDPYVTFYEGCLSLPGFTALVPRSLRVRVSFLDDRGEPRQISAEGWYARILQHEIDHLHGKLYIDHMLPQSFTTLDNYTRHWKDKRIEAVLKALGIAPTVS
jgi:peptide deformylase